MAEGPPKDVVLGAVASGLPEGVVLGVAAEGTLEGVDLLYQPNKGDYHECLFHIRNDCYL